MITVKTPYRISFFGGGTDYPDWYNKNGGSVISSSINKYSNLIINPLDDIHNFKYRIRYYYNEMVKDVNSIKHPVVRECLKFYQNNKSLDIIHHGDLPARTGLGSSSSFTVGLVHALSHLNIKKFSKRKIALDAIYIEQKILKEFVGSQDQVIAAYGGFNEIKFNKKNTFKVLPLEISNNKINILNSWSQLVFTGILRPASKFAKRKIMNIKNNYNLDQMMELNKEAKKVIIECNDKDFIYEFGKLLNRQWELKKSFEKSTTNNLINLIYEKAILNGGIGGKILGAGGGGFFLLISPPKYQKKIIKNLNLKSIDFKYSDTGSELFDR